MIKIQNLFLKYIPEFYALYDINLEIHKGEHVAFVGEKDSGKTSLIRVLVKLDKPTSGEVFIKGIPLPKVDFSKDVSLGFLPATPILFENKTVYENMLYVAKLQCSNLSHIENSINKALMDFDIQKLKNTLIHSLTLFQKYVVSLARLSLRELDVLLVEDVLNNLKSDEQEQLVALIKQKILTPECVLVLSTEKEDLAKMLCNKIVYFENGSIVKEN